MRCVCAQAWAEQAVPVLQLPQDDLTAVAFALLECRQRELHFAAVESVHAVVEAQWKRSRKGARRSALSGASVTELTPEFLAVLKRMVETNSWWDTVDSLAKTVGYFVQIYPKLATEMDKWGADSCMWVRRVALIHQVRSQRSVCGAAFRA